MRTIGFATFVLRGFVLAGCTGSEIFEAPIVDTRTTDTAHLLFATPDTPPHSSRNPDSTETDAAPLPLPSLYTSFAGAYASGVFAPKH